MEGARLPAPQPLSLLPPIRAQRVCRGTLRRALPKSLSLPAREAQEEPEAEEEDGWEEQDQGQGAQAEEDEDEDSEDSEECEEEEREEEDDSNDGGLRGDARHTLRRISHTRTLGPRGERVG